MTLSVGVVGAAGVCGWPLAAFPVEVGDAAVAGFAAPLGAPDVAAAGGALPGAGAVELSADNAAAAVSLTAAESFVAFEPRQAAAATAAATTAVTTTGRLTAHPA